MPSKADKDLIATARERYKLAQEAEREIRREAKIDLEFAAGNQWDQADVHLLNLQRMNPDCGLYRKFSEKVTEMRRNPPPPDWDGVTSFEEK